MKTKVALDGDEYFNWMKDAGSRVEQSFEFIKNEEDKRIVRTFWSRFLPADKDLLDHTEHGRKKTLDQRLYKRALFCAFQQLWFISYWSGLNKTPKRKKFPSLCKYEVLIPYFAANTTQACTCIIVREGLRVGQTGAGLFQELLPHLSRVPAYVKAIEPIWSALAKDRYPIVSEMNAVINNLIKAQDELKSVFALSPLHYGTFTLEDEHVLRLPCYNVPLQAVFEACASEMGTFGMSPIDLKLGELLAFMRDNDLEKFTFHRRSLSKADMNICLALLQWPTWQLFQMTDIEQLDYMLALSKTAKFLIKSDPGSARSQEQGARNLRDRCLRRIRSQLKK